MKKLFIGLSSVALVAGMGASALAADYGTPMMEEPVMMTDPGFDWDGLYAGMGIAAASFTGPGPSGTDGFVRFVLGANMTVDSFLFGAEGWVGGYTTISGAGMSGYAYGGQVRAGYLATPDVLLYGSADAFTYDAGGQYAGIGAGVEFAVTDNMSLDTHYTYYGWSNTGFTGHEISGTLNFHF